MAQTHFSIGSTLANMVNVESTYGLYFHAFDGARVPLTGLVRRRSLAAVTRHDGFVNSSILLDLADQSDLDGFMYALFGGYETAEIERYMMLIDERGRYAPFLARIEKASFQVIDKVHVRQVVFPLWNCRFQSVTKTSNTTITSSERHVKGSTAGGNVTLTLPAASAINANTVITIEKIASANTLTIQRGGSDTLNGGTSTLTRTSIGAYYTLISDGVSNWRTL